MISNHRRSTVPLAAVACATALFAAACGSSSHSGASTRTTGSGGSKSAIVIGNEADLTGNATVGVPGSYGVKFAVKQINAHGGIDGHPLELKVEDSQGSATGGIAAVRRLVEVDHVQAIVNTASSDATVPAIPVAQGASVPFIVSAASDTVIVAKQNTYVFMAPAVPVNVDLKEYLKFLKSKHFTNVALIATTAAFASAAVSDFKAGASAAGVRLATIQTFGATDTDFSAQVHAAQSSHADAVFVIGDFTGGVLKAARAAGLTVPFLYDASSTDPLLIQSIGSDAAGMYSFQTQATQLLDATTPPMSTWKSEFSAAFPHPPAGVPSQFSLEGYEATYVLAEGLEKALSHGSLSGSSIKSALETVTGFVAGKTAFPYAVPISYPVTFASSNHAGDHTVTPVIVKGKIFVPVG